MGGRTSQLQIRVTPAEKIALKRLAAAAGQNVSMYVLSRALPSAERDLSRILDDLRATAAREDSVDGLLEVVSRLEASELLPALGNISPVGLPPLAQNRVAAVIEDVAQANGLELPAWAGLVPPLPRPYFRWPLLSLRPQQLRTTRVALRRRNVFDPGFPTPTASFGALGERAQELASLGQHLARLELDVEFYLTGGAVLTHLLPASGRSARPRGLFDAGGNAEVLGDFVHERGWSGPWLSDTIREIVGRGPAPGGFLDLPNLKVFAPPAEYVLAMKTAALAAEPTARELDDLRFVLRSLNVESAEAALAIATRYIADRHLPTHALEILRRLFGG